MLFSLKLQRDNRQNALAVDPAKRKTGEKGCIFHRTVKMNQPYNRAKKKASIISYDTAFNEGAVSVYGRFIFTI